MGRERPPDYADRLPRLVPKEEADISHLSDEMAEVLYPGRRPHPFRMGIAFQAFTQQEDAAGAARAVELARRSPRYRESRRGSVLVHEAQFETTQAGLMRELFQLVGQRPGTEVTVDGKKLPYARELWLPLFWIFVGEEN